jgi:CheY-like chemotaxis protein
MRIVGALVLLVEDCEQTRGAYERVLRDGGYRVATAVDGQDGLAKASELQPDVIVTDLDMPVVDGLEVAARIRADERLCRTPIVVLTACAMRRCMWRAREIGCDRFLFKPCRSGQLLDAVEECLRERSDEPRLSANARS